MGVNQAPTAKGKQAAASLKQAAKKDERKTEARKGSKLAKGAKRFEERSPVAPMFLDLKRVNEKNTIFDEVVCRAVKPTD